MVSAGMFGRKYIAHPIYPRMLGYVATIVMHVTNGLQMMKTFKGEVSRDETVRQFFENQFLLFTVWNIYLQIFYAGLGLSCDVLSIAKEGKKSLLVKTLKAIRDPMFSGVVWPFAFVVLIVFWVTYSYDHGLILPPRVDEILTVTANHVIHTAVLPVVLWEIVFRPRRVPGSHVLNLVVLYAYAAVYLSVLFFSYNETGAWAYPILDLINGTIYLYAFFATSVLIAQIFYILQWYITESIWCHEDGKIIRKNCQKIAQELETRSHKK